MIYDNKFLGDVIGSRTVSKILKFKAADSVAYIEYNNGIHEEVGLVTQRNLVIVLKIRSRLMAFFFGIIEDSDLPPIIGTEVREQRPGSFMDFNLTDEQVYVTTLKVLNRQAIEKTSFNRFLRSHLQLMRIWKDYMQKRGMVRS